MSLNVVRKNTEWYSSVGWGSIPFPTSELTQYNKDLTKHLVCGII